MKIVQIISTHTENATKGMVEDIVRLEDGQLVTRHIYPPSVKNTLTEEEKGSL